MKINKLKKIKQTLFWGGLGFVVSSMLGLDGFRDTLELAQLFIGVGVITGAVVLGLISVYTSKK